MAAAGEWAYFFCMRAIGLLVLVVGVIAAPASGAGQLETGAAPDEPVPIYTNADLEKFGPSDAPEGPVRTRDEGERQFVQAFLDREYARVDAERDYELLRAAADERAWQLENPRPRYVAPYLGVYGSPWVMPFRYSRAGAWHPYPHVSHRGTWPAGRGTGERPRATSRPGSPPHGAAGPRRSRP